MTYAVDYQFMARALRLAQRGLYTTTPNPRVGCVIVHGDAVVGEGWHEHAGGPHAEVNALQAAGAHARGATAYGFGLFSRALTAEAMAGRFHGNDERIDVESLSLTTQAWLEVCERFLG